VTRPVLTIPCPEEGTPSDGSNEIAWRRDRGHQLGRRGRIASADSMAWSYVARRRKVKLDGCTHATCSNCMRWAIDWYRTRIVNVNQPAAQLELAGIA
jgi:hypothetical protein